ncbi:tyrosine-type recombinase/integrase [Methanoregula sp.]|uniref:tyrosine-type recombinase/integrase n=1 Tax=Methanoregula sp. TaxID=2052170 RepID=UPI003C73AB7D
MQYISDFLNGKEVITETTGRNGKKSTVITKEGGFKERMTRLGYRSSIFQFLDGRYGCVRKGKDSTPDEQEQYEDYAAEYLEGDVRPLNDLQQYKDYLHSIQRPPHSISQNVTCVRIWLENYDHSLNSKELRELKKHMPKQRGGVTREDEITQDTMRLILNHTGDVRLKTAILIMMSSGIRIGELVKLQINDINLQTRTIYISDLVAKNKERRLTFYTEETGDALKQYLKERDRYMENAVKMSPRIGATYRTERHELFPVTTSTLRTAFISVLKRAGIHNVDQRTGRTTIHPHSLRKYFMNTLKYAGCHQDIVEDLSGHEGYLSSSYRRYTEQQLREMYEKYANVLTIGDYGFEVRKELTARVDSQTNKVLALEKENTELAAQHKKMAEDNESLKKIVKEILKTINSPIDMKTVFDDM